MDIDPVVLIQEENQKLAVTNLEANNDTLQLAANQFYQSSAYSLDFLATAAKHAHTVASISHKPANPESTPNPASTPSHNIANVGGSAGPSPAGNYPARGCVMYGPSICNANVPSEANSESGTGYVDKLNAFIDAMKNDPDDMAEQQLFFQYLQNLSMDGLLGPNSQCTNLLNSTLGTSGLNTLISQMVMQNAALSYFGLYNGTMGDSGALSWLNSQIATIEKIQGYHDNPVLDSMLSSMQFWETQFQPNSSGKSFFDQGHMNASGQYYWTSGVTGDQFIWTQGQSASSGNNFVIYTLIAAGGVSGAPGSFWDNLNINQVDLTYRMQMFDLICKQFPNDPSIILTLFIMMIYNNEFNGDLTGETDQTDRMSYFTNQMTPITNEVSNIGKLSTDGTNGQSAVQMMQGILQITALANAMHCSEGIAQSILQNVYQPIMNATVNYTQNGLNYQNVPLSQAWNDYSSGKITAEQFSQVVDSINPPPSTTGGGTTPNSPNQQLQTITNAIQQANAVVSQQSKTISTESASISNTLDQILKILNFATNTSTGGGGGFVALEGALIQNQISH